jgi:hypothetical protein
MSRINNPIPRFLLIFWGPSAWMIELIAILFFIQIHYGRTTELVQSAHPSFTSKK